MPRGYKTPPLPGHHFDRVGEATEEPLFYAAIMQCECGKRITAVSWSKIAARKILRRKQVDHWKEVHPGWGILTEEERFRYQMAVRRSRNAAGRRDQRNNQQQGSQPVRRQSDEPGQL